MQQYLKCQSETRFDYKYIHTCINLTISNHVKKKKPFHLIIHRFTCSKLICVCNKINNLSYKPITQVISNDEYMHMSSHELKDRIYYVIVNLLFK